MLGKEINEWRKSTGIFTAEEIFQQPATWKKTAALLADLKTRLSTFVCAITAQDDYDIILTGAGTSEFVGSTACAALNEKYGFRMRSIGTTDICAAPHKYLSPNRPTLMVSYARSGNSPESLGAVKAADAICREVRHVFITCNSEGALARAAEEREDCFCIKLSPETNDRGFAMTSSFSNMYLATLLAFASEETGATAAYVDLAAEASRVCFENWSFFYNIISEFDYDRIVFLGSGELKGIAQESALKTLELTAGRVTTMFDTPMGFRHGPKSVVNDRTLTVIYLSDNAYTRRYEIDLLNEMNRQKKGNRLLVIENAPDPDITDMGNYVYSYNFGSLLPSGILGLGYITAAQLLALFKSQRLGITTDNPCPTGEVNRVVSGVTIYPTGENKNGR